MIRLTVLMGSDATIYVPAPCRGVVVGLKAVWQTNAVEPGDTIIAYRGAADVNTVTAVATGGLVVETGVRDTSYKDLVFDPASTTSSVGVIELVANGAAGNVLVTVEFDEGAYVEETAKEA